MKVFAVNKCRAVVLGGALLALSGMTLNLNAQDVQTQGSTRSEMAQFDAFLDAHADIDAQLRGNPSLLKNAEFLEAHPELESFINQHPQIQTQVGQNPSILMDRAKRFDANEARRTTNANPDLTRQQVSAMDLFLDRNPNIDKDLRRNPGLINNAGYLQQHPELQTFLNQHPNMKEEIAENPRFFMEREQRFDAHEQSRRGPNPNPDLTRQQVAELDKFLDSHPDVDQTLGKNPWLIRNAQYLKEHPELQSFLNQHPELKEESVETPKYLMQREQRFDGREQARSDRDREFDRDRDANRDRDTTTSDRDMDLRRGTSSDVSNREIANVDDFLDRHQDIAKSLQKKPELINDQSYLKRHKDLSEFLSEHPAVQQEVRDNPSSFMRRESQFETRNVDRDRLDRDRSDRDRNRVATTDRDRETRNVDNDLSKKDLQEMDHFLDKHKKIEKDLQKNPTLANDHDYLKHHKSLESFLSKNPRVGEELRENPSTFMQKQQRLEQHRMTNRPPATAKPKTKIEEKEQTHSVTPH
jgi:phage-related protein